MKAQIDSKSPVQLICGSDPFREFPAVMRWELINQIQENNASLSVLYLDGNVLSLTRFVVKELGPSGVFYRLAFYNSQDSEKSLQGTECFLLDEIPEAVDALMARAMHKERGKPSKPGHTVEQALRLLKIETLLIKGK